MRKGYLLDKLIHSFHEEIVKLLLDAEAKASGFSNENNTSDGSTRSNTMGMGQRCQFQES